MVEVHPGAAIALRAGPADQVRLFRTEATARHSLLRWLESQGLRGITADKAPSSHYVAACACALAAWKWQEGKPAWIEHAVPPIHPYDYAC